MATRYLVVTLLFGMFAINHGFAAPLKAEVCEALLVVASGSGVQFDVNIREIESQLKRSGVQSPASERASVAPSVQFQGPISKITGAVGEKVGMRIEGLRRDLEFRPQRVIKAFEVRGANIESVLRDSVVALEKCDDVYANQFASPEMGRTGTVLRRFQRMMLPSVALLCGVGVVAPVYIAESSPMLAGFIAFTVPLAVSAQVAAQFAHNRARFDKSWESFLSAAMAFSEGQGRGNIFISSVRVQFPIDFTKALRKGFVRDQDRERVLDLHGLDVNSQIGLHRLRFLGLAEGPKPTREELLAFDLQYLLPIPLPGNQWVYLDQILYFDEVRNEPVWVFAIRD